MRILEKKKAKCKMRATRQIWELLFNKGANQVHIYCEGKCMFMRNISLK